MKISRSGYYKYLQRKPSKRDIENEILSKKIKEIFDEHKGRYGTIRITKVLNSQGIQINRKRVGKLMHKMGLYAKGSRYKYKYFNKKGPSIDRPNLLNQVFQTNAKNKIWLGDITYIPTKRGTLYLAIFLDLYTRKVTGWSMDTRMNDTLVINAFNQAYGKEHPNKGLIIHTDQGSQYTSSNFQSLLRTHGATSSVSRKGNPYDNALMESFYKTLKRELVHDADFEAPEQAQMEIFKYIETYYNTKRMHSSLDFLTPVQYEKLYS